MCEDSNGPHPYHPGRGERLRELCGQLGLDAILLITGWDGCHNLGSRSLVEWLCDRAGSSTSAAELDDIYEEGLFVITPSHIEWSITHMADDVHMDDAAVDAAAAAAGGADPMQMSPRAGCEPCGMPLAAAAAAPGGSCCGPTGCSSSSTAAGGMSSTAGAAMVLSSPAAAAAAAAVGCGGGFSAAAAAAAPMPDGKLSLLMHLRGSMGRVGVPLGVEVLHGMQHQVDTATIYQWPLLMALAELAGIQPEQLFQEVVDISPSMPLLLGVADGTQLHSVLRVRRPLLHRAWSDAMGACWRRSSGPKLDLSEAAVAAPLTEFVSGCGCRLKPGQYQPLALPPRVLFGPRTCRMDALSSGNVTLRSLSTQTGSAALHATVEASDACSALRVARTIFFGQGIDRARAQLQMEQHAGQTSGLARSMSGVDFQVDQVDLFDLMAWYCCAVDAAWACMQHFAAQPGATWDSAQAAAAAAFQAAAAAAQLPAPAIGQPVASTAAADAAAAAAEQSPHLSLQLLSWTGGPRPMPLQQPQHLLQHNMRFKTLRVAVAGIRSRSSAHRGLLLGSVLYSDTFLDVPALHGSPAQLINLTATHCPINTFNFWGAEAAEATQLVSSFRRHLQHQLQQQLQAAAQAQLAQAIQAQVQAQARRRSIDNPVGAGDDGAAAAAAAAAAGTGGGSSSPPSPLVPSAAAAGAKQKKKKPQRRASMPQQQQLMLLQQQQLQQQQQQQQQQKQQGGDKASLRRLSLPQDQQQLLLLQQQQQQQAVQAQALLQQLAATGGSAQQQASAAAAARKQQALFQQQLLIQLQQQQHLQQLQQQQAAGARPQQQQQQQQQPSKHAMSQSAAAQNLAESAAAGMTGLKTSSVGGSSQPVKRSCCSQNTAAGGSAAGGAASPPPGLSWALASPTRSAATTPPPGLAATAAAAAAGAVGAGATALNAASPHKQAAAAAAGGGAGSSSSGGNVAAECVVQLQRLGGLLLPSGEMPGEVGLVLTGAGKCAVMDGPLYPHQGGLAFVSRPSKVHLLLMDQVEGVWLQDLSAQLPGYAGVGPCLVLRGRQPACGLLPACFLTDNPHVAIPLRQMSKVCREHWVAAVLPAWQAATGSRREARGASAPWPLPPELQPAYRYWMQGQRKRYLVTQPDEAMDGLVAALDRPREQQGLAV